MALGQSTEARVGGDSHPSPGQESGATPWHWPVIAKVPGERTSSARCASNAQLWKREMQFEGPGRATLKGQHQWRRRMNGQTVPPGVKKWWPSLIWQRVNGCESNGQELSMLQCPVRDGNAG